MKKLALIIAMLLWATAALATNCTLTGQVFNVDGSAAANAIITFNPVTQQPLTTGGTAYTNQPVSTTTDSNGNLTSISLPQGLIVQISIQENGATFGGYTAIVPFMPSATFVQMNQGISTQPLNVLASSQPPTGPLSMNNQKITNLACPSTAFDALAFGCNATINNLTVNGSWMVNSGLAVSGLTTFSQLGAVSAPVVAPIGITGATSYSYYIACHDANPVVRGASLTSSAGTTSIGNADLTVGANLITWVRPAGYATCDVLRGDTAHSIALNQTGTTWTDAQNGSGSAYLSMTRNTTGDIRMATGSTLQNLTIGWFNASASSGVSSGSFLPIQGSIIGAGPMSEALVAQVAPTNGLLIHLFAQLGAATCSSVGNSNFPVLKGDIIDTAVTGVSGSTGTFTLDDNGSPTGLNCTTSGSGGNTPNPNAAVSYGLQSTY